MSHALRSPRLYSGRALSHKIPPLRARERGSARPAAERIGELRVANSRTVSRLVALDLSQQLLRRGDLRVRIREFGRGLGLTQLGDNLPQLLDAGLEAPAESGSTVRVSSSSSCF